LENRAGKREGTKEKTQIGSIRRLTAVRANQHGCATPTTGRGGGCPVHSVSRFFASSFALPCRGICNGVSVFGHLGPLLAFFFDFLGLKKSFNIMLGACKVEICKSRSKQAKPCIIEEIGV